MRHPYIPLVLRVASSKKTIHVMSSCNYCTQSINSYNKSINLCLDYEPFIHKKNSNANDMAEFGDGIDPMQKECIESDKPLCMLPFSRFENAFNKLDTALERLAYQGDSYNRRSSFQNIRKRKRVHQKRRSLPIDLSTKSLGSYVLGGKKRNNRLDFIDRVEDRKVSKDTSRSFLDYSAMHNLNYDCENVQNPTMDYGEDQMVSIDQLSLLGQNKKKCLRIDSSSSLSNLFPGDDFTQNLGDQIMDPVVQNSLLEKEKNCSQIDSSHNVSTENITQNLGDRILDLRNILSEKKISCPRIESPSISLDIVPDVDVTLKQRDQIVPSEQNAMLENPQIESISFSPDVHSDKALKHGRLVANVISAMARSEESREKVRLLSDCLKKLGLSISAFEKKNNQDSNI